MLRIAGQTARPIGLKFFVNTHGWRGVFFSTFFSMIAPGPSASNLNIEGFDDYVITKMINMLCNK